ncbi:succinate dehydrogenase, hydrophobic membrane anchor protein [Marivibrio halodurans]|uniref:Succinate dehydrogenase hydrophobic membrane anchor subunit n=1 Tax=Marivibrio halodurans TaxID=2039722 RepID=A0A8J7SPP2_9PROT|nr:succinate dehydrogenase, hydrophobic membrane anchor protein [Marivibrio halodurans]MBP5858471.1 succinate dehydrogenase, hydrophobic membrane anchor protein [Marivibrio halodurans]
MSLKTPLGAARGLGSAKNGTHHWIMQRITAVALVPLTLWFVFSALALSGAGYAEAAGWLADPVNAVLMLLLIVATFHHLQLGLQVVIEDYIHGEAAKIVTLLVVKFAAFALGMAGAFAVLKVAFTA